MSFTPESFMENPSQESLESLRKVDLLNLAEHLQLTSVRTHMRKHEIRNIIVNYLVDNNLLDKSALSLLVEPESAIDSKQVELELARLEFEKCRMENERIEREMERLEREKRKGKIGEGKRNGNNGKGKRKAISV